MLNISTLKKNFINAAEKKDQYLKENNIEGSFKEDAKTQKFFNKIIKKGPHGLDEIQNIAQGKSLPAAIIACTLAYSIMPEICSKNLKHISKTGGPKYSLIAKDMLTILKMNNISSNKPVDHGDGRYSFSINMNDMM